MRHCQFWFFFIVERHSWCIVYRSLARRHADKSIDCLVTYETDTSSPYSTWECSIVLAVAENVRRRNLEENAAVLNTVFLVCRQYRSRPKRKHFFNRGKHMSDFDMRRHVAHRRIFSTLTREIQLRINYRLLAWRWMISTRQSSHDGDGTIVELPARGFIAVMWQYRCLYDTDIVVCVLSINTKDNNRHIRRWLTQLTEHYNWSDDVTLCVSNVTSFRIRCHLHSTVTRRHSNFWAFK